MPTRGALALEKSNTKSQGMLPIIVSDAQGRTVCGFRDRPRPWTPNDGEPEDLILAGHWMTASNAPISDHLWNPAAHWIGDAFRLEAERLDAPKLPESAEWFRREDGCFMFDEPALVYARLESWNKMAACTALGQEDAVRTLGLAALMRWTLPTHMLTYAMQWHAASTVQEKQREVDWHFRTGGGKMEWLVEQYKAVLNTVAEDTGLPLPYDSCD